MNIDLRESQVNKVLSVLKSRQEELQNQLISLKNEFNENLELINSLKGGSRNGQTKPPEVLTDYGLPAMDYKPSFTWFKKISLILAHTNRKMTTSEIMDALMQLEPMLVEKRRTVLAWVSGTISTKVKEGKLIREMRNKQYYIGLP